MGPDKTQWRHDSGTKTSIKNYLASKKERTVNPEYESGLFDSHSYKIQTSY